VSDEVFHQAISWDEFHEGLFFHAPRAKRVSDASMWGEIYRRTDAVVRDPRTTADEVAIVRRWLEDTSPVVEALDAGCGEGHHLFPLRAEGFKVRGVDIHRPACLGSDLGVFVEAPVDCLPFAGGRISHVYCLNNTAFFWDDACVRKALAEFHRVLAPGGRLLLHQSNIETVEQMLAPGVVDTQRFLGSCAFEERDSYDPVTQTLRIERTILGRPDFGEESKTGVCEIRLYRWNEWAPLLESCGFVLERLGVEPLMTWIYARKVDRLP
jgi:SAM-dependent methyltransferase